MSNTPATSSSSNASLTSCLATLLAPLVSCLTTRPKQIQTQAQTASRLPSIALGRPTRRGLTSVSFLLAFFIPLLAMFLPGNFSVSPSGAANYTVPIEVPPGLAGMQPSLSLSYSSQGGNGLLGMGWGLSGLSSIGRCPRTMAQDGVRGGVNYDNNDRYCLDGQRLVLVSGTYGAAGSEYRTEIDAQVKVVAYGSQTGTPKGSGTTTNAPQYFKVWTKSGQIIEYGNTADSRIEAEGTTVLIIWLQNRILDRKNNYIDWVYTENNANGEWVPSQIKYTGNLTTNTPPQNTINFVYETRPDKILTYQAGSTIQTTQRLASIALSLVTGEKYTIGYGASTDSVNSRVVSIQRTNLLGQLIPTTFSYQDFSLLFSATSDYSMLASGQIPIDMADVNGDGLMDWVQSYTGPSGNFSGVYLNTGSGWKHVSDAAYYMPPFLYSGNDQTSQLVDLNGDGLVDWVTSYKSSSGATQTGTFINTGAGWVLNRNYALPGYMFIGNQRTGYFADLNGDLNLDYVCTTGSYKGVYINSGGNSQLVQIFSNPSVYTRIVNKSIVYPDLYTKGTGIIEVFPRIDLQYPKNVVSRIEVSDGVGGLRTNAYKYGGLKAEQGTGRGSLGFAWQEVTDVDTNLIVRTDFNQSYPFIGMPKQVTRKLGSQLLGQASSNYAYASYTGNAQDATPTTAAGKRYRVFGTQSSEATWDLNGTFIGGARTTQSNLDDYNNVGSILVESMDANGAILGYSKQTLSTYDNDATNWILGRLKKSTVTNTTPATVPTAMVGNDPNASKTSGDITNVPPPPPTATPINPWLQTILNLLLD